MRPLIAYLHILSVELWLACWMFTSTRQRRRLSLVCRLFRSICFPPLIERQSADVAALVEGLDRRNWVERTQRLHRTAVRMQRLAGSPLVLEVRAWKVSFAPPLPQRWTRPMAPNATWREQLARRTVAGDYSHILNIGTFNSIRDRVLTTFFATLGLYQSLISLNIEAITIDASLRKTLASLSQLHELVLDGCDITLDGVLLTLQRFTLSATRRRGTRFRNSASGEDTIEGSLKLVDPVHLLELNLHGVAQSTVLITGFGDATFSNLGHLSLHAMFHAGILLDLLKRCPRLESLVIQSISSSPGTPIPQHFVPLLRTLTVPWDMVRLFTFNRPICDVVVLNDQPDKLVSIDDMKGVFIDISRSSAPIRSLLIPCTSSTLETLTFLTSVFPTLPELSMDIPEKDEERWAFRCGNENDEDLREDRRSVELNDEAAFDGLPADVLSDSEENLPPVRPVVPTPPHSRSVPLWADPPTLEERVNRTASLIHSAHSCRISLTPSSF